MSNSGPTAVSYRKQGDSKKPSAKVSYALKETHLRLGRIAGQSGLEIRNVMASGRRTSVRLEPVMWDSLEEISRRERVSMPDIFTLIDQRRGGSPFTGAIRLFVLTYFRVAALADPNF